jgi:Arginine repressor
LRVDFAGRVVLVKCYSGVANAACEVFDALACGTVVRTLCGDYAFLIVPRSERRRRDPLCGSDPSYRAEIHAASGLC